MSLRRSVLNESGFLPDFMEESLRSWLFRAIGVALMVAAAMGWLCLLTWSASEPSLNQASDSGAHNLLGPTGGLVADLLFQSLGLAAIFAMLPIAVWGYELFSREYIANLSMRLTVWPISAFAIASAFAALPTPGSWPLHHGFGGLIGNLLYGFAAQLFYTIYAPLSGLVVGGTFLLTGLSALAHAMGFRLVDVHILWQPSPNPRPKRRVAHPSATPRKGLVEKLRETVADSAPRSNKSGRERNTHADATTVAGEKSPTAGIDPTLPGHHGDTELRPSSDDQDVGETIMDCPIDEDAQRIAKIFAPKPGRKQKAAAQKSEDSSPKPGSPDHQAIEPTFEDTPQSAVFTEARGDDVQLPSMRLLKRSRSQKRGAEFNQSVLRGNAALLEDVLKDFGIKGKIVNIRPGPVVTLYELRPERGVKAARVIGLADDIARSLSAVSARIAVVPGRNAIGIELPNIQRETVQLRELFETQQYRNGDATLPIALGLGIDGSPVIADLARMPHLLIAGTTGSGKSVGVNAMILSLLYRMTPEQCRFIMIDPKMLELSVYNGIPHLLNPVVTDPEKALLALNWVVREMEERYKRMSKLGVRNLEVFNKRVRKATKQGQLLKRTVQTGFDRVTGEAVYEHEQFELEPLPYIVVVIDEMADLMLTVGKEIEVAIQRLAQMARAAGIHLITATQRPSVDVITGVIKANLPTRMSYKVATSADSRTILGHHGAEQLLGAGDMLFNAGGGQTMRVHGAFVSEDEIEHIVAFLRRQGEPDYVAGMTDAPDDGDAGEGLAVSGADSLYDKAVAVVLRDRKVSTSYLQRRLSIGYNRAADLVERMEAEGLISPPNKTAKREILIETT